MLQAVASGIDESIAFYKDHNAEGGSDWSSALILDEHMEVMDKGLLGSSGYQQLEFDLIQGRKKCLVCIERTKASGLDGIEVKGGGSNEESSTSPEPAEEAGGLTFENQDEAPRIPVTGSRQKYPKNAPGKLFKGSPLEGAVCRPTSKLLRLPLFSSGWHFKISLIPLDPRRFQIIREGRNNFDDFAQGPSYESWKEFADEYASIPDQQLSWDWQPTGRSVYEL